MKAQGNHTDFTHGSDRTSKVADEAFVFQGMPE
jgi:hypothetical protein